MMDLENRLRSTFSEMADEQPPSSDPRGDLERRLASRGKSGWRTPALVAAAAAVVAAVAVPVVVFGGSGGSGTVPVGSGGTQPATESPEPGASEFPIPDRGEGREFLGGHQDNGTIWSAFAIQGGAEVCSSPMADPQDLTCSDAPFGVPPDGHAVLTFALDLEATPMASKLLFVTAPEVASLTVRDYAGADVGLAMVAAEGDKPNVFVADFGGQSDGFGYTAKDANGNVIEEALT